MPDIGQDAEAESAKKFEHASDGHQWQKQQSAGTRGFEDALVAEGQGFEPWKGVNPCRMPRPVHSTALPSLHGRQYYRQRVRTQLENDDSVNAFYDWMLSLSKVN